MTDTVLNLILEHLKDERTRASKLVVAVTKGVNPESKKSKIQTATYYLIAPGGYDDEFESEITELDIRIAKETGEDCSLRRWPVNLRDIRRYIFLGEVLYQKK